MYFSDKILKPIMETSYLTAENAYRYRAIIRIMFQNYEKIQYWVYPGEVYNEIKKDERFSNYTFDECKRDFQALENWQNVIAMQDTTHVRTLEEYKNRNFRYQLTEYTVEIERLTLRLENLSLEGASLEPSLLERIRKSFMELEEIVGDTDEALSSWWNTLNEQFIRLNQNYQDYIRTLNSADSEEMMKTTQFLIYKDSIIDYLRKFIHSLQLNTGIIEKSIQRLDEVKIKNVLERITNYEMTIFRLGQPVSQEQLFDHMLGRWQSIYDWFVGNNGKQSESNRIFDITNESVRKITRYASQISEVYGSGLNRKDDYATLACLFGESETLNECHVLAAKVFGVTQPVHLKGLYERKTESTSSSVYDEEPFQEVLKSRKREKAKATKNSEIRDYQLEKSRMLSEILQRQEEEKELMNQYITNQIIDFETLGMMQPKVRNILLRWLSKGLENSSKEVQTEDGRKYHVRLKDAERMIVLRAEDGTFEMPPYQIVFAEGEKA